MQEARVHECVAAFQCVAQAKGALTHLSGCSLQPVLRLEEANHACSDCCEEGWEEVKWVPPKEQKKCNFNNVERRGGGWSRGCTVD